MSVLPVSATALPRLGNETALDLAIWLLKESGGWAEVEFGDTLGYGSGRGAIGVRLAIDAVITTEEWFKRFYLTRFVMGAPE